MSWREFIADLVGSLAWPALVAFIAYRYRKALEHILKSRFGRIKTPVGEFEWAHELADLEAEAKAVASQTPDPDQATPGGTELPILPSELFANIVEASPAQAVIQAVDLIDDQLRQKLEDRKILTPSSDPRGPAFLVTSALASGLLNEHVAQIIVALGSFRERLRHGSASEGLSLFSPDVHVSDEARVLLKVADTVVSAIART